MQERRGAVHTGKGPNHQKNKHPEQDQPEKSGKVCRKVKEQDAPEEIYRELKGIDPQGCALGSPGGRLSDERRSKSHQNIEDCPNNGEKDWRWSERGFQDGGLEFLHPIAGKKSGKRADGAGQENRRKIGLILFHHKITS